MFLTRFGSFAAMTIAVLFAAGCSGTQSPVAPQIPVLQSLAQRHVSVEPSSTGRAFFSDWGRSLIDVFDTATYRQVGTISSVCEPDGLATDKQGYLYEADQCSNSVHIYAPGDLTKPTAIIHEYGWTPSDVAVDASGNIYVANDDADEDGQGKVIRYAAKTHAKTLMLGGPYDPFWLAVDRSGNVWCDGQSNTYYNSVIGYWAGGTGKFNYVNISFKFPGQMQFDNAGNLVLDDQAGSPNGGSELFIYPPGSTKPSRSFVVQTDGSDVVEFTLDKANQRLFAPDDTNGNIYTYRYSNDALLKTVRPESIGYLIGAAVVPAP